MPDHWQSGQGGRESPRYDGYRQSSSHWRPHERDHSSQTRRYQRYDGYDHGSGRSYESSRNAPWREQGQYDRPNGNGQGYTFRGAAQSAQHSTEYHDFSFRASGPPAPSFPQQSSSHRGPPPNKRVAREGPSYKRHGQNGAPNTRRPYQKKFGPKPAHERDILKTIKRETTPEQLQGMNTAAEPRFSNVDNIKDVLEDPATFQQRLAAQQAAPKWTNPDPYTALPPVVADAKPKKDLINVIRKAKREAAQTGNGGIAVAKNDDFISFDMGDEFPKAASPSSSSDGGIEINVPVVQAQPAMPQAPTAPRAMRSQAAQLPPPVSLPPKPQPTRNADASTWNSVNAPLPAQAPSGRKRKFVDEGHMFDVCASWQPTSRSSATPWLTETLARNNVTDPGQRLHEEICDFYAYVRPQPFEEAVRLDLINRVRSLMNTFAGFRQTVEIHAFGSFASGLYLPCADMDLVALSSSFLQSNVAQFCQSARQIRDLASHLRRSGIAARNDVLPIVKARVPLIKFTDRVTGIKVDLSFENPSGLWAMQTFETWHQQFPAMPVIVSLIKQLLAMREQNEVHTGGFGGFTVICLVVSMLQLMPETQSNATVQPQHYGHLLQTMLKLYGEHFNFEQTGIVMLPPGYYDKSQDESARGHPNRLTIIDPNNEDNDISGGSRNVVDIFDMFRRVRNSIQSRLDSIQHNSNDVDSILGCAWAGNYAQFDDQRERLRRVFADLERHGIKPARMPLPDLSSLPRVVVTSLKKIAKASGIESKRSNRPPPRHQR